jgi:hypothetical protein
MTYEEITEYLNNRILELPIQEWNYSESEDKEVYTNFVRKEIRLVIERDMQRQNIIIKTKVKDLYFIGDKKLNEYLYQIGLLEMSNKLKEVADLINIIK